MEPITSLLDAFIKLADRIINLEKAKLQDRQILFREIVKPLFEELEPVALNYLEIFRKARKALNRVSLQELKQTIEFVEEERVAMLVARSKVEQMVYQVRENIKDDEVNKFVVSIFLFFYNTEKIDTPSRTRIFLLHLRQIENQGEMTGEIPSEDRIFITNYIDESLATLEEYWNEIVRVYEKLNIYSVVPQKFVRKSPNARAKSQ